MLFFMHVPKTAGTSFRLFLERAIRQQGGEPAPVQGRYESYASFLAGGAERARRYDLICGHYPYHVAEMFPVGTKTVTVLRDPIERCLSHIKHQIAHEARTGEGSGVRDLDAFIELPRNRFFLDTLRNVCVKYLVYRGDPATPLSDADLSLNHALDNAKQCWLGFSEDLDGFVARTARDLLRLGSGAAKSAEDTNASADTRALRDLAPKNLERLRALNQLDLRLVEALRDHVEKTGRPGFPEGGESF